MLLQLQDHGTSLRQLGRYAITLARLFGRSGFPGWGTPAAPACGGGASREERPSGVRPASEAATEVYNRIMVTHLLMDATRPNRVAGAVGFNVRNGNFYVFRAKAVIVAAGGASHIFKPRAVGEGMGRTWYAPWSSGSAYALPILAGAKMTQMENRIVLTAQR
jgi:succinate dehydrogenase/fumarate reductase flavoprotein subunit